MSATAPPVRVPGKPEATLLTATPASSDTLILVLVEHLVNARAELVRLEAQQIVPCAQCGGEGSVYPKGHRHRYLSCKSCGGAGKRRVLSARCKMPEVTG